MKYNERIWELREDHSLSQENIAKLLHVGQRTYSDYESGKTRIPVVRTYVLTKLLYLTTKNKAMGNNS